MEFWNSSHRTHIWSVGSARCVGSYLNCVTCVLSLSIFNLCIWCILIVCGADDMLNVVQSNLQLTTHMKNSKNLRHIQSDTDYIRYGIHSSFTLSISTVYHTIFPYMWHPTWSSTEWQTHSIPNTRLPIWIHHETQPFWWHHLSYMELWCYMSVELYIMPRTYVCV